MAEKVRIAELTIDNKSLLDSLKITKTTIDKLTLSNKELKKSGDTSSETFIKNDAQLKKLRTQYGKQIKTLQTVTGATEKLEEALKKEIKGVDQAKQNNAELRKIKELVNETTEEGAIAILDINKKIDANTALMEKNSDANEKRVFGIGRYTQGINKAKIGTKVFGTALKALGIGIIIAGIAKLTEAFSRNQKITNTVSTVFNGIGIVFDKVVGVIVDTVGAVYDATDGFDALGRVMGNLLTLIITPLKLQFFGIKLGIQQAQLIWEESFFGGNDNAKIKELTKDIEETKETLKNVAVEAVESGKAIVKDFGEATSEVGSLIGEVVSATTNTISKLNLKEIAKDAAALTAAKNNIEALVIAQERLVQTYEIEAEKLRQKRDDESRSIEQRKKDNEDLGKILEEQSAAELKIIELRIGAAAQELALNKGNIDLENEVLRLKNERLSVENRIETQRSEKLANDNSLRNEELAQIKEFEDKKRELKNEIDLKNQESEKEKEQLRIEKEFEKQEAELERIKLNEDQKTELRTLLEESKEQQLSDIQEKYRSETLKKDKEAELQKIKNKQKTLDAILSLTNQESVIGKAAIIAKQALALKEFAIDKGLFSSKLTLKTSEATADIAAGTAKSASAAPFPANLPLIAGFVASAAGLIGTIKGALNKGKSKPKEFASGGVLRGASHLNGGIPMTLNGRPGYEAEGDEIILTKGVFHNPILRSIASDLNVAGGGIKFANGFGGINGTTTTPSKNIIDYDLLASKIVEGNAALPTPQVAVSEIRAVENTIDVIESGQEF